MTGRGGESFWKRGGVLFLKVCSRKFLLNARGVLQKKRQETSAKARKGAEAGKNGRKDGGKGEKKHFRNGQNCIFQEKTKGRGEPLGGEPLLKKHPRGKDLQGRERPTRESGGIEEGSER